MCLTSEARNGDIESESQQDLEVKLDSLTETWLGAKAWQDFRARCAKAKIHVMPAVPDGNCLGWSVLRLLEEDYGIEEQDGSNAADLERIEEMREEMLEGWKDCLMYAEWQEIFTHMLPDALSVTPERNKTRKATSPETPEEKRFVKRHKSARSQGLPAPKLEAWKKEAPTVKVEPLPEQKRKGRGQEQQEPVPDFFEPPEVEVPLPPPPEAPAPKPRNKKRKGMSCLELRIAGARMYLNDIGCTYPVWQSKHWAASCKKAGKCGDGVFTDLLKRCAHAHENREGDISPNCETCQELLDLLRFSKEELAVTIDKFMAEPKPDLAPLQPPRADEGDAAAPVPLQDVAEKDVAKENLSLSARARSVCPFFEAGCPYIK